jgi:hypothetical protein
VPAQVLGGQGSICAGGGSVKLNPEAIMGSAKQRTAARKNVRKAAAAAKSKRSIAHLSTKTRRALGKQGAKVAKRKSSR